MTDTCQFCGLPIDIALPHDRDRATGGFLHRRCYDIAMEGADSCQGNIYPDDAIAKNEVTA